MNSGIEIEIIWFDEDVICLRVRGANSRFAGAADVYIRHGALANVADAFRGFPLSIDDQRELELGTFDPAHGGGGARFRLRCTDAMGHAALEVQLRADPHCDGGRSETASFVIPIESAAIDDFVNTISAMTVAAGARARLAQAIGSQ